MSEITIVLGDITEQEVDAIVNAANEVLLPGGGVCGAIHRAGGPEIERECAEIGWCDVGGAVKTTAGDLPAKMVIHTVGPVWSGGMIGEATDLVSAYERSIQLAAENGAKTIAFPSISTGIYGYPVEEAAFVALTAISEEIALHPDVEEVRMVLFSRGDVDIYTEAAMSLGIALSSPVNPKSET